MKTNRIFGLAAIACGFAMSMTSCGEADNPASKPAAATKSLTISFENQTLNENGFWIGDAKGNSYSYSDDWGGKTTTYTDNAYVEGPVSFPVTYNLYESAYGNSDFWSGFAISNRTETSFNAATLTPDQYNSTIGGAHSGKNFCVLTTYGEKISLGEKGAIIKGLFYTNSAYTMSSILKGDSYAGAPFEKEDWLKCTITGTKANGTTASVDIDLAKDFEFAWRWLYADLSSLGKVVTLDFAFTGSRSNDWGVLTPAYICLDDIEIEY